MRIIRAIVLSSIALALIIAPVLAIVYTITFTVLETGGTSYTMLPVIFTVENDWMVSNGFFNSSANDTNITSSGSNVKYMVADNKTIVASSLAALTQKNYLFTTGNTETDRMSIIPGYGGYFTVPDNAPSEPSNNFTDTKKVYLSAAGTVVRKNVTYYEYYDGTTYYVDDYSTHIVSTAETEEGVAGTNHAITMPGSITAGNLLLICFGASGSGGINTPAGWTRLATSPNGFCYVFYKFAAGGDTVTITTTNSVLGEAVTYNIIGAGTPESGTAVNGASANPDPPAKTVTVTPFAIIWIAVEGNDGGQTVSAYPAGYVGGINANTAQGCVGTSHMETDALAANPGTYTITGVANWDANTIMVPITSIASTSEMSAAVAVGEHVISVTSSAVGSSLTVDSVEVDTAAALTITDTSTNWQICSAATIYMEYYKHYVGGNLISWYQPNSMIVGTTLPDRSATGGSNDGTFTWGTNPVAIDIETSSAVGSSTTISTSEDPTTNDVLPTVTVSDWYKAPDIGGSLLTNPLRPFVLILSDSTTLTERQAWVLLGGALCLFILVFTAKMVRGHHIITGVAVAIAIFACCVMTVFPWYALVLALFAIIMGAIMERKPSL